MKIDCSLKKSADNSADFFISTNSPEKTGKEKLFLLSFLCEKSFHVSGHHARAPKASFISASFFSAFGRYFSYIEAKSVLLL